LKLAIIAALQALPAAFRASADGGDAGREDPEARLCSCAADRTGACASDTMGRRRHHHTPPPTNVNSAKANKAIRCGGIFIGAILAAIRRRMGWAMAHC
jgi:hypothetical protein